MKPFPEMTSKEKLQSSMDTVVEAFVMRWCNTELLDKWAGDEPRRRKRLINALEKEARECQERADHDFMRYGDGSWHQTAASNCRFAIRYLTRE